MANPPESPLRSTRPPAVSGPPSAAPGLTPSARAVPSSPPASYSPQAGGMSSPRPQSPRLDAWRTTPRGGPPAAPAPNGSASPRWYSARAETALESPRGAALLAQYSPRRSQEPMPHTTYKPPPAPAQRLAPPSLKQQPPLQPRSSAEPTGIPKLNFSNLTGRSQGITRTEFSPRAPVSSSRQNHPGCALHSPRRVVVSPRCSAYDQQSISNEGVSDMQCHPVTADSQRQYASSVCAAHTKAALDAQLRNPDGNTLAAPAEAPSSLTPRQNPLWSEATPSMDAFVAARVAQSKQVQEDRAPEAAQHTTSVAHAVVAQVEQLFTQLTGSVGAAAEEEAVLSLIRELYVSRGKMWVTKYDDLLKKEVKSSIAKLGADEKLTLLQLLNMLQHKPWRKLLGEDEHEVYAELIKEMAAK
eukprot:TRINITY_DN5292_c0_g1_i2.p1 TRINITY_DN5292_c0_g1~~TRINITY_DN5292_c0_g1_i2.p1  ORF type:complete len:414 (-),score=69.47 TRINITY_DN5292_c0_g1_i2:63-1304(-)